MWVNQAENKRENEAVKVLSMLVDLFNEDEAIMEYFSNLPGVTYQYARYTDWIKPFLMKVMNGPGSTATSLKEKATLIFSKYDVYEAYLLSKDGPNTGAEEE